MICKHILDHAPIFLQWTVFKKTDKFHWASEFLMQPLNSKVDLGPFSSFTVQMCGQTNTISPVDTNSLQKNV
jgi:hypothetical protein